MHPIRTLKVDTCHLIVEHVSFVDVINYLHSGTMAWRQGWNGKNMFISLQTPDEFSKMSRPYIFMKTADNHLVPWVASQSDILADDWTIAEVPPEFR